MIYTDYARTNPENAVSDLQVDLNKLNESCNMNEICINIGKSKAMAFGTRYHIDHCYPPIAPLGNDELELFPTTNTWAPLLILTFTKQAAETCKSVSSKSYCLSKSKRYLDTDSMIKLYKAYMFNLILTILIFFSILL